MILYWLTVKYDCNQCMYQGSKHGLRTNYSLVPELDSWHNPQCRLRFIILNGISAGWWRGTTHFLIPITTTTTTGHCRLGWSQLNQKNGDKIDRSAACCCCCTRWLLFANHAANLCCSQHTVGRKYCGKWEERNNTVKLVKTITERRDIKSSLWAIFLLPSSEKMLPDVFQSVPVQC